MTRSLSTQIGCARERPIDLLFDALVLGLAGRSSRNRGGIVRYASELLLALDRQGTIQLKPLCSEALLEGLARQELVQLGLIPASDSYPPRERRLALLSHLPTGVTALAKGVHRLQQHSPWSARRRQRRWSNLLRDCAPGRTVIHSPYLQIPPELRSLGPLPTVVTIHDMLPVLHPEFFTAETRRQFHRLLASLRPSDHVICVSESTRGDFLRHGSVVPERQVHVTPLAASPALGPVQDPRQRQQLRQRLGLGPEDRVILSLSTLEPRKNLQTLLSAFEQLHGRWSGPPLKLVLAGSEGWKHQPLLDRLQASPARQAILLPGRIAEEDLPALLSLAELFVYPSLYEGFGLPPLEALQCGLPVIAANCSSLPEVVGDAGILVDPRSSDALAEAITQVLSRPELQAELRQRALRRARQFSWERTAALTAEIYHQMLAEPIGAMPSPGR